MILFQTRNVLSLQTLTVASDVIFKLCKSKLMLDLTNHIMSTHSEATNRITDKFNKMYICLIMKYSGNIKPKKFNASNWIPVVAFLSLLIYLEVFLTSLFFFFD
uniref:Odorant receptor 9 n=1 Tax=Streltzoviella insularis TaxID=1206366 RepID=A0A7D5UML7_9NEOP|nr:odorant receptor 9 [Streltzoviella insularis]